MTKNNKFKFKLNKGVATPFIKNFFRDNKLFLITFFGLYLAIFAISIFIVYNFQEQLCHNNYYQMLLEGNYSYFKVTLTYVLFNILFAFCAMITYRKKFAFAIMYFVVTFIAYRLAVNIVGSWLEYRLIINILNAVLFYFIINTIYVITIVLIISHINTNYLYCNDRCPMTLKSIFKFSVITTVITSICIIICTVVLPLILCKILF
ncbi:MAG: hypothetical protein HFE34_05980 [Clostridia bacterium]|nr:hypothetical protein [Clostridia bacterium]